MDIKTMQLKADDAAAMLKTLANPTRLLVLCALVEKEHTAGELEELVGLSQSAVSQHLAKLRHEGIVNTRRDAQKIYYSLSNDSAKRILETMHNVYCADLK